MPRRLLAALLLLLAACAVPGEPPALRPATEVQWEPQGAPRAVIVAVHGFNDFKGAFKEFGAYAAAQGILVEAYDQPGFGARPDRGHWPGTAALVAALLTAVQDAREHHPGLPVYVLGESMGAAVALMAQAGTDARPVDGLILVAPAVWNGRDLPPGYLAVLRVLSALVPSLRIHGRHLKRMASDNIEMLRALGQDPLYLRETRIDGIAGLVNLMVEAQTVAPRVGIPMLVLLGAKDQIVPPDAAKRFVATLPAETCQVATYPDGWHLLLRDHQRGRVFADIASWIDGLPLASGLARNCGPTPQS